MSLWIKWLVQGVATALAFGMGYLLLSSLGKLTEGWLIGLFLLALVVGAIAEHILAD